MRSDDFTELRAMTGYMPQIQFSMKEVDAILSHLGSITGLPPSERPRFDIPDEAAPH